VWAGAFPVFLRRGPGHFPSGLLGLLISSLFFFVFFFCKTFFRRPPLPHAAFSRPTRRTLLPLRSPTSCCIYTTAFSKPSPSSRLFLHVSLSRSPVFSTDEVDFLAAGGKNTDLSRFFKSLFRFVFQFPKNFPPAKDVFTPQQLFRRREK